MSCVAVGRRSGRVMAVASPTSISVWVIGKQSAYEVRSVLLRRDRRDGWILIVSQTFTAISGTPRCIGFDAREELLAVGASDGSVKIWDLIQRQLARSFAAHSTAVTALAFHPHAQFLYASFSSRVSKRKVLIAN